MSNGNLTVETLRKAAEKLDRPSRRTYGVAMSPEIARSLNLLVPTFRRDLIIDDRMRGAECLMYSSAPVWEARIIEQQFYEALILTPEFCRLEWNL